jgi:hypothetical protein
MILWGFWTDLGTMQNDQLEKLDKGAVAQVLERVSE